LEEDRITGYSNLIGGGTGLDEKEITWYSNPLLATHCAVTGLEEDKIAWFSNWRV